jgi:hypothetical protein
VFSKKLNMGRAKYLVAGISLFISIAGSAQLKGFSLGPYAELAWPRGNLEETNKNGIGVGFNGDIRLGKLGITGSAGFIHFNGRSAGGQNNSTQPAINAVPVRAGLKYHFFPLLYAKFEAGVAKFTNGNNSALILAPGLGVRILGLDVEAKYESWIKDGNSHFMGLKLGYNF